MPRSRTHSVTRNSITEAWDTVRSAGIEEATKRARKRLGRSPAVPPSLVDRLWYDFHQQHWKQNPIGPASRASLVRAFADAVFTPVCNFNTDLGALGEPGKASVSKPKPKPGDEPLGPKARARNLELAWFVVERTVPFAQFFARDPNNKLKPGCHGPKKIWPWDLLAEEWNRHVAEHNRTDPAPLHPTERGDTLARLYNRAVNNVHLARDLLTEFEREINQTADLLWKARRASRAQPTPERQAEMTAWLESPDSSVGFSILWEAANKVPELISHAQSESRAQAKRCWKERRRLTRRDLVSPFVLYHMMYEAGRRPLVRRAGNASLYKPGLVSDLRPLGLPLRYWFLSDARGGDGPRKPLTRPSRTSRPSR